MREVRTTFLGYVDNNLVWKWLETESAKNGEF